MQEIFNGITINDVMEHIIEQARNKKSNYTLHLDFSIEEINNLSDLEIIEGLHNKGFDITIEKCRQGTNIVISW